MNRPNPPFFIDQIVGYLTANVTKYRQACGHFIDVAEYLLGRPLTHAMFCKENAE